MTKRHLVIATRESPLALRQTELVKQQLLSLHPHLSIELLGITTIADKRLDVTLQKIGGKGLFVKELEEALLDGRADIAVHSMKDVPMDLPPGLILPVIAKRAEVRDVFVSNDYASFASLPRSAKVGTASVRRKAQLKILRNDLSFEDLRGNVNTRLRRLDEGNFAAIILAGAGLIRMGFANRIRDYFSIQQSLPAAGQGALGIECRSDDKAVLEIIKDLNDSISNDCVSAERALCRRLEGGCQVPIGAYAQIHKDELQLQAMIASADGRTVIHAHQRGPRKQAESLGLQAAESLLQQGAEKILNEFHD